MTAPADTFARSSTAITGRGGRFISTEPSATINDHKVPAKDSINEAMMDFVCYRKGGVPVGNPFTDAPLHFNE